MMNTANADRLIGFLKAVAFYLEKAQQEANALKAGETKDRAENEPKSGRRNGSQTRSEVSHEGRKQR